MGKKTKQSLNEALIKNLYGDSFSYFNSQRRIIAKHYQNYVTDLKTLKDLMRQNGFKKDSDWNDPSTRQPNKAFSARVDLRKFHPIPNGGIDTKVINFELMQSMSSIAQSGPTVENNPNLEVFDFKKWTFGNYERKGVP